MIEVDGFMRHRSPDALINPDTLAWVRQQGGYSQADMARKAQTHPDNYREWEQGEARPTMSQFYRLAHGVHRPVTFFFLFRAPGVRALPS